jgi:hypothetical protein
LKNFFRSLLAYFTFVNYISIESEQQATQPRYTSIIQLGDDKKIMKEHISLMFITALAVSALVVVAIVAVAPAEVKAQLPSKDVTAKSLQELGNKLAKVCKNNPFSSNKIPSILIPGNSSGKNGGITAFGNANSEHGKNGPISIGGGSSSGVSPNSGDLGIRAGNGGIAFCGSANGQSIGGP